jgi:hypothetical protein
MLPDLRKNQPVRLKILPPGNSNNALFLILLLLSNLNTVGQIDQRKLDSLSKSINSSAKEHRLWQDSFTKVQDSIYRAAISKTGNRYSPNLDNSQAKKGRRAFPESRLVIALIVIGALVFSAGRLAWLRGRNKKG